MASIFKQQYTVKNENGKRIRKKSAFWYVDYKNADGMRKRVKGFKDKAATVQLAAKLEREAEQAQVGIIDKYKEHRKRPLIEHLDDFKTGLINKGTTEKHACLVYNRAKAVIESCKFAFIDDISASKTQNYLAQRRRDKLNTAERKWNKLSIRSSNFYLQAMKQFCRWLVADNRTGENNLAYLQGQNPQTDIKRRRRALTSEELNLLITTALKGQPHSSMSGKERAMLYTLAVSTGLRASELASLTWQSFNLSDSAPSVTVLAAYSKHRRDDVQPLRLDTAQQFADWKAELGADEQSKVFGNLRVNKAAKMIRKDLEAADIAYKDASGRVADFHSLRHTFISNLSQSGVMPKVAQSLARHSTISLTMDTYTHLTLHDERAALDSLPELPDLGGDTNAHNETVAVKTGTDDLPVEVSKSAYKPAYKKLTKNAFPDKNRLSANGNKSSDNREFTESPKPLPHGTLGNESNQMSPVGNEKKEEAATGFEPVNNGFANRRLGPLGYAALFQPT